MQQLLFIHYLQKHKYLSWKSLDKKIKNQAEILTFIFGKEQPGNIFNNNEYKFWGKIQGARYIPNPTDLTVICEIFQRNGLHDIVADIKNSQKLIELNNH
jgi:hypothetical protein